MSVNKRTKNAHNPNQGPRLHVLTVCSAGLLRSPTLAWILSNEPYNFNTRACGYSEDYSLIVLDEVLVAWADNIIFVNKEVEDNVLARFPDLKSMFIDLHTLNIPDRYEFRDPELVKIATEQLNAIYEK